MKQTAMQIAIKEIAELWSSPSDTPTYTQIFNILENKLEMEKQQIIDAANLDKRHYDNAEQYYNETFNKREIPNIKNEFLAKIK